MQKHSKSNKLLVSKDIAETLKMPGPKTTHLSFHLRCLPNQSNSRLGLAIPKKKAKRAVDRNKIKRLLREHFRKNPMQIAGDLVIKLNRPVGGKTRGRLREQERKQIRHQVEQTFKNAFK